MFVPFVLKASKIWIMKIYLYILRGEELNKICFYIYETKFVM